MTDCVIIGAGLSGLSCAKKLESSGFRVHIVEARDRIGGRACTHKFHVGEPDENSREQFAEFAELGCAWIHGKNPKNAAAKLAADLSLTTSLTDWDKMWFVNEAGIRVPDSAVEDAEKKVLKAFARAHKHPGSLQDALTSELPPDDSPARQALIELVIANYIQHDVGHLTSLCHTSPERNHEDNYSLRLPKNNQTFGFPYIDSC
jgi:monoamine oxidase